jgi:hypothetical protein
MSLVRAFVSKAPERTSPIRAPPWWATVTQTFCLRTSAIHCAVLIASPKDRPTRVGSSSRKSESGGTGRPQVRASARRLSVRSWTVLVAKRAMACAGSSSTASTGKRITTSAPTVESAALRSRVRSLGPGHKARLAAVLERSLFAQPFRAERYSTRSLSDHRRYSESNQLLVSRETHGAPTVSVL